MLLEFVSILTRFGGNDIMQGILARNLHRDSLICGALDMDSDSILSEAFQIL